HSNATGGQRDQQIGQLQAGISGDDPRVVPFRDLAEEDVRVDVVWQLQVLRTAGQVVGEHDFARGYRQQDDAARNFGDFLVGHRRVAAGKVHRMIDEVLNARTAALGLIIYGNAIVLFAEILE